VVVERGYGCTVSAQPFPRRAGGRWQDHATFTALQTPGIGVLVVLHPRQSRIVSTAMPRVVCNLLRK